MRAGCRARPGLRGKTRHVPNERIWAIARYIRQPEFLPASASRGSVDYGLTAQAALEAATSSAAKIVELEAEIGSIAPGMIADIVAVGGDPVTNISALRDVRLVLQRGTTAYAGG